MCKTPYQQYLEDFRQAKSDADRLKAIYSAWAFCTDDQLTHSLCWLRKSTGLCSFASRFMSEAGTLELWRRDRLHDYQKSLFKSAGLSTGYPFGPENFYKRQRKETQDLDPARLRWVTWVLAGNDVSQFKAANPELGL